MHFLLWLNIFCALSEVNARKIYRDGETVHLSDTTNDGTQSKYKKAIETAQVWLCKYLETAQVWAVCKYLALLLRRKFSSCIYSCCAVYTNIDSISRHSFEDREQFCRDINHRIIWFWEERLKDFRFWTHFVENMRSGKNYPPKKLWENSFHLFRFSVNQHCSKLFHEPGGSRLFTMNTSTACSDRIITESTGAQPQS